MGAVASAARPHSLYDVVIPSTIVGTFLFPDTVFQALCKVLPSVEFRRSIGLIPHPSELGDGGDVEPEPQVEEKKKE